jgi:hypothetical protein
MKIKNNNMTLIEIRAINTQDLARIIKIIISQKVITMNSNTKMIHIGNIKTTKHIIVKEKIVDQIAILIILLKVNIST